MDRPAPLLPEASKGLPACFGTERPGALAHGDLHSPPNGLSHPEQTTEKPDMKEQCLHVFANCRIVNGSSRSAIYDLQRERLRLIPRALGRILQENHDRRLDPILQEHAAYRSQLREQIEQLQEEGFLTFLRPEERSFYPELDLTFSDPSELEVLVVQNRAIDAKQLMIFSGMGLRSLVLIRRDPLDEGSLEELFEMLPETGIENVLFIFTEPVELSPELLDRIDRRPRITHCWIFGCEQEASYGKTVRWCSHPFRWDEGPQLMRPSMELFTSSQERHSYFDRKLFISEEGYLEPSYESRESGLHIDDLERVEQLRAWIDDSAPQGLWQAEKDTTRVCKDCEFRHLCVDARIPFYREDIGLWDHSTPCPYDPYSCSWKGT
jgi:hypothetical protein